MINFFTKTSAALGLATLAAGIAAPAEAGLVMKYAVNGGAFTTITDNGAGDLVPTAGTISFMLLGLGGVTLSLDSGNNNGYIPGAPVQLHLDSSGNVRNTAAADSLEVWVSSTNYVHSAGNYDIRSDFGVSANPGTVKWDSFFDAGNTLFGTSTLLATKTTTTQGATAGDTEVDPLALTTLPFSLSQRFLITWGAGTRGAINLVGTQEVAIPEPATLALMGIGLLGLGIARRRKA